MQSRRGLQLLAVAVAVAGRTRDHRPLAISAARIRVPAAAIATATGAPSGLIIRSLTATSIRSSLAGVSTPGKRARSACEAATQRRDESGGAGTDARVSETSKRPAPVLSASAHVRRGMLVGPAGSFQIVSWSDRQILDALFLSDGEVR